MTNHSKHTPPGTDASRIHKEEEFGKLMDSHRGIITKVCYMYARSSDEFKELFQEVQINLWQSMDKFRGLSARSTWIYRVSINTCISCYRRNRRHEETLSLSDSSMADLADHATDDQEHARCLKEMYLLINRLPALDRAIVLMWLDEKSYQEIADVTGLTRTNVASRLNRCKQRLARMSDT